MRTLLQIMQAAADELGSINRPASVIGSLDQSVQQLLALANREGKELSAREGRDGGWPQLRKLFTITTVEDQANYDVPADLQYFINTTAWDRTQKWPLRGPVSPQEWQILKSGTIGSVGPRTRFRLFDGDVYLEPTPESSGSEIVIEYYSTGWCASAVGAPQALWMSDLDVPVLPDDLFILGLIWRFRKAKGLEWGEDYRVYEAAVTRELGRSGMAPIADLTGEETGIRFIDHDNIPDSGFGGV